MTDRPPGQDEQARYDELSDAVFELYESGRYEDALERLSARGPGLEPWSSDLTHVAACLQSRAGRPEQALATLQAALEAGDWWAPRILTDDDDLAAVRRQPGFDDLLRVATARAAAYNASVTPDPPVVLRPAGPVRAVAVVLHGSGQRADATAETWSPALAEGLVVLAVASSQRSTPTHTSWPEHAPAVRDIGHALDHLDPAVRSLPVLAGGFSAGGRAAMLWALTGGPVSRLLVVAPALWSEHLPAELCRVPGLVLLGGDDPLAGPVQQVGRRLDDAGLRLETVEGLGHAYPEDFAARLVAELRSFVDR